MVPPPSFQEVFARAREGSKDDLRTLIDEYGPQLRRVVRHRLDDRMRVKFDSLDFVQMVWVAFFEKDEPLKDIESPEQMLAYLVGMARHKVIDQERRRASKRHGSDLEQPISDDGTELPPANMTTPSQYAMARETYELLEAGESERDRAIMELRCQGLSYTEIGTRMNLNERTVRRIIERLLATHSGPRT